MPILLLLILSAIAFPTHAGGIEITVLYNNVPHTPGCVCQWGFACLIRGTEDTILFDTGGDGRVLLANMERLGVNPYEIDCVVLSHSHGDHTGGVTTLLPHLRPVRWYIPADFVGRFRKSLERAGHTVIAVTEQVEICPAVFSTGELGSAIKEQSLIVESEVGLIVITGCAHPGIVYITATARKLRNQDIHLVLGGFHLGSYSEAELARIVGQLQALGVEKVAPSHCTGDKAIRLFADTWKGDCLSSGCGARITVP
jgi:7,8-dihydropterin-6-yl-methyl-4-(beta-D-ribofuranosyl)aminobenzene 5'-phosphate synthase